MSGYVASLVSVIGINLILALSLNIITGFCGQVSLGHAAFYGVGAYTAAYLAKLGAPLPLTLLAGAAMAFSSVSVVANSVLLARWKPNGI